MLSIGDHLQLQISGRQVLKNTVMEIPGQPYAFLGSRGFRSLLHQGQTLQLRSQTSGDDPCQRNTFVELAGEIDHENLASIANTGQGRSDERRGGKESVSPVRSRW